MLSGVKLNGKMVGVFKKDESAARKLIDAHRLMGHIESVEPTDGRIKVCHFKSQMAKAGGFGIRGAGRWGGKGEKFDDVFSV